MTTRRMFLRAAMGLPGMIALEPAWSAPDPSRVALVIGNSAYRQGPLENPANDAKAMGSLFTSAGFTTETRLNTSRSELLAAIDRFADNIQHSEAKLAVFYYAGHGAQLDWRNYFLPVDISVRSPADVKNQCVDLGILLEKLSKAKDKTFVIILDACRDDPFKGTYRPEQKGLSQFDAPVGSLLAYATSPGSVAEDGSGKNGLYTGHLVQELSNRQTRIEDALKRVRLKVRLESDGKQIPWETTSLESDVFLFPEVNAKLSESELLKHVEADMLEWTRIKSSEKPDDWKGYLLKFPNGRFAEIAQIRLANLLTPTRPVVPSSSVATSQEIPAPVIEIVAGKPIPQLLELSKNPNSAGRFPLGRKFTVGDEYGLVLYDLLTKIEKEALLRVTSVEPRADRVELNDGAYVWDGMGNIIKSPLMGLSQLPRQFFPAELQIGKKWLAAWSGDTLTGVTHTFDAKFHILSMEDIRVPAGEFRTFLIEFNGWDTLGRRLEGKSWVVPGLNLCIKQEILLRKRGGGYALADGYKLAWAKQHAMDGTVVVTTQGSSRSVIVRNSNSGA